MKIRRVGTVTSGICLIAFGAALLLKTFAPSLLNIELILSLWPVIFISLGIELLCFCFSRAEGLALKMDFGSVALMFLSMGFGFAVELLRIFILRD